jgi:hypothetical protein
MEAQTTAASTAAAPKQVSFKESASLFGNELVGEMRRRLATIAQSTPAKRSSDPIVALTETFNHRVIQLNALQSDGYDRIAEWRRKQNQPRSLILNAERDLQGLVNRVHQLATDTWRAKLREETRKIEERRAPPKEEYKPETVRPIRVGLASPASSSVANTSAVEAARAARAARKSTASTGEGEEFSVNLPRKLPAHRPIRLTAAAAERPKGLKCTHVDPVKGACGNWRKRGLLVCRHHVADAISQRAAETVAPRLARLTAAAAEKPKAARCSHVDPVKGKCKGWCRHGLDVCVRHDPSIDHAAVQAKRVEACRRAANEKRAAKGLPPLGTPVVKERVARQPRAARTIAHSAPRSEGIKAPGGEGLLSIVGRGDNATTALPPAPRARTKGVDLPWLGMPAGESVEAAAGKFAVGVETFFRKKALIICTETPQRFNVVAAGLESALAAAAALRQVRTDSVKAIRTRCLAHIALWRAMHPGNEVVAKYADAAKALVIGLFDQYDQSFARALARDENAIEKLFEQPEGSDERSIDA